MKYKFHREDLDFEKFDMGDLIDNSKDSIFKYVESQKRLISLAEKLEESNLFEIAIVISCAALAYNSLGSDSVAALASLGAVSTIAFCDALSKAVLERTFKINHNKISDWKKYYSRGDEQSQEYINVKEILNDDLEH